MARTYFLRVGGEAPHGPLTEETIRDALRSGVIGDDAEIAEAADGPFARVRDALAASATPAKKSRALVVGGGVLGALVLLGAIGGGVAYWFAHRPAKLCAGTSKLLAKLHEPLGIEAYVTHGTPELDKASRAIDDVLRAYAAAGSGHVVYRIVDVKSKDDRRRAKDAGFFTNPFARAANAVDTGHAGMMTMQPPGDDKLTPMAMPYAQAEITNTILVFKNMLDWLSLDDDLGACTSAKITSKK